jgi:hypothetical protein
MQTIMKPILACVKAVLDLAVGKYPLRPVLSNYGFLAGRRLATADM